jgi:glycosyltransferase involved in cell wall biosynthesis
MNPPDTVRVLAASAQGLTTPGFRARVMVLRPELARHGVLVEPLVLFTQAEVDAFSRGGLKLRVTVLLSARRRLARQLATTSRANGVSLIQRQVDLLPVLRLERRAAATRRLIWDVDDAIWLDSSRAAGGHELSVLKGTYRKVKWLASRADRIVAANAYLADFLSQYSDSVDVVPSVVETRSVTPRRHDDGEELVFGWIGSATTVPYLLRLGPAIRRVSRELSPHPIKLLVVGGTFPCEVGYSVESVPWSIDHERQALNRIDVGLMPMPDNAWTRGKSAYKALQYMSAGIPVVADDVGVTSGVVEHGRGGFVVRDEAEWVDALTALGRDPELRARLGHHGRRRVEADFSVVRWAPFLTAMFKGESSKRAASDSDIQPQTLR